MIPVSPRGEATAQPTHPQRQVLGKKASWGRRSHSTRCKPSGTRLHLRRGIFQRRGLGRVAVAGPSAAQQRVNDVGSGGALRAAQLVGLLAAEGGNHHPVTPLSLP